MSAVKIFSGTGSAYLAESIAKSFGKKLGNCKIQKFSDGEFQPIFQESIRGGLCFPGAKHLCTERQPDGATADD